MIMTLNQIRARKKWILGNEKQRRISPRQQNAFWLHQRGYHKGDIRCTRCDKWINPENPFEAIEIRVTERGKMLHDSRYCKYGSGFGVAAFSTVARSSKSRKSLLDETVRY